MRSVNFGPVSIQLARRRTRTSGLARRVTPKPRDVQRALDFLRGPHLEGDGQQPSVKMAAAVEAARRRDSEAQTLADVVANTTWYHTIELPGGVVTNGTHDLRALVPRVGLPDDLGGQRALDVATFNGFWAFELERRGASVVAIDLPTIAALDLPPAVRQIVLNEEWDVALGRPFEVAAHALRSKVERRMVSVYDLDPAEIGTFDFVYSGDVLLHLAAPMLALHRMRAVASGRVVIVDRFDPDAHGQMVRYRGGWTSLDWWAPSLEVLVQWVLDAGFRNVRVHDAFQVTNAATSAPGFWRAVIHAEV
jgi:tRNA (mo5U34)-methyltransferase